TLVHGTDPEIFVLIEARGRDAASARWQYAVARMTNSALRLRLRDKEVWAVGSIRGREVTDPNRPYTTFFFNEVPDFLRDALVKPKPRGASPQSPEVTRMTGRLPPHSRLPMCALAVALAVWAPRLASQDKSPGQPTDEKA